MPQKKVAQRSLPALMTELEEQGALNVRRGRAGFDGKVLVTWDEPGDMTEEEYQAAMLAWVPLYILSGLLAALIIAVVLIVG